jgi:hypothetical protein
MSETRVVHVGDKVPGAVYIGRAMPRQGLKASPFANPFKVSWFKTRAECLERYRQYLFDSPQLMAQVDGLKGKPLACWCRHDGQPKSFADACHGDVLIELLEGR